MCVHTFLQQEKNTQRREPSRCSLLLPLRYILLLLLLEKIDEEKNLNVMRCD